MYVTALHPALSLSLSPGDLAAELNLVRTDTNTRITAVKGLRGMRDQLSKLRDLVVGTHGGMPPLRPPTPPSPTQWGPINTPKPIRVPPPKFDGTKEGTKVTTWFEQFDDYSAIVQIAPCELVANASLCLSGRAAEQWALMKKSLIQRGKDPGDFETFKLKCFPSLLKERSNTPFGSALLDLNILVLLPRAMLPFVPLW
jgi:hypothetical protein